MKISLTLIYSVDVTWGAVSSQLLPLWKKVHSYVRIIFLSIHHLNLNYWCTPWATIKKKWLTVRWTNIWIYWSSFKIRMVLITKLYFNSLRVSHSSIHIRGTCIYNIPHCILWEMNGHSRAKYKLALFTVFAVSSK